MLVFFRVRTSVLDLSCSFSPSRSPWAHYAISRLRPQSICWAGSVTEPFHRVTPPAGGRSSEKRVRRADRGRLFTSHSQNVFDSNHDLAQDVKVCQVVRLHNTHVMGAAPRRCQCFSLRMASSLGLSLSSQRRDWAFAGIARQITSKEVFAICQWKRDAS